jgi:pimeloyl-ACP methyl ester carboxylesterase
MMQRMIEGPQGKLGLLQTNQGTGIPLVFLHADPGRASQWIAVIGLLQADHPIIALDFRGAGASAPARDDDYSLSGRADDVDAVVKALGLKRFVIVAHSGGAAVALTYAADHAGVAGIFMVDPATDPRGMPQAMKDQIAQDMAGPDSLAAFLKFVGAIAGENPAVRDQVLADATALAPAARIGVSAALSDWQPDRTLDAFHGPMMILSTPATDTAEALYRLRPLIPHQVVQTNGHWLQLDHPDVVAEAIRAFLAGIDLAA